eukprot:TRINITY_DN28493_c0_g1_i1.p1 TRINITY_DN28493_c0_g1~~TRINITY_DN28493_c0_g1_i1.p1  ORF type:complete len:377 (+),score=85.01 TRINITY_DN28493_c0_g1_i1:32-1132(+)
MEPPHLSAAAREVLSPLRRRGHSEGALTSTTGIDVTRNQLGWVLQAESDKVRRDVESLERRLREQNKQLRQEARDQHVRNNLLQVELAGVRKKLREEEAVLAAERDPNPMVKARADRRRFVSLANDKDQLLREQNVLQLKIQRLERSLKACSDASGGELLAELDEERRKNHGLLLDLEYFREKQDKADADNKAMDDALRLRGMADQAHRTKQLSERERCMAAEAAFRAEYHSYQEERQSCEDALARLADEEAAYQRLQLAQDEIRNEHRSFQAEQCALRATKEALAESRRKASEADDFRRQLSDSRTRSKSLEATIVQERRAQPMTQAQALMLAAEQLSEGPDMVIDTRFVATKNVSSDFENTIQF